MNQIGASHITIPDLLVCGSAILLLVKLFTLPPNSAMCRIVALLSGCMVVGVMFVLFFTDSLSGKAVMELGLVAMGLCVGLDRWHVRAKSTFGRVTPSETSS
jgi:Na+-translocating ferredoxin:NAD+ oxidoreductase RnfD subunit